MYKLVIIIAIGILVFGCNQTTENGNNKIQEQKLMAKRIIIDELKNYLSNLKIGKTNFDFIGITSNGIDCIYFTYENEKFNIEYEAMVKNQIPYITKIKEFADTRNIKTVLTTYNNIPKYKSTSPAPVLKLVVNTNIEGIYNLGRKIQLDVFGNNKETFYEIVP